MTWTIKTRGAPSGRTVAEYMCPEHGRFEATVERDANGDPPAVEYCTVESDDPYMDGRQCNAQAPWVISAPLGKVKLVSVTQGKVAKAERPTWTDTEKLADRGAWKEWKQDRAKVWKEHRLDVNARDGRKGT